MWNVSICMIEKTIQLPTLYSSQKSFKAEKKIDCMLVQRTLLCLGCPQAHSQFVSGSCFPPMDTLSQSFSSSGSVWGFCQFIQVNEAQKPPPHIPPKKKEKKKSHSLYFSVYLQLCVKNNLLYSFLAEKSYYHHPFSSFHSI